MVETSRLESGHTLTGIGGSNPSLSAIRKKEDLAWEVPALRLRCGSGFRLRARTQNGSSSNPSLSAIVSPSVHGAKEMLLALKVHCGAWATDCNENIRTAENKIGITA